MELVSSCSRVYGTIAALVIGHICFILVSAYEDKSSLEAGKLETHVFVGEVLSYYQVIAQALVSKKVPVVPQLPMSIIHHSMFSQSSNLLASTLWYLCQVKKSVNPMAEARKRDFAAQKDTGPESLVTEQLRKQVWSLTQFNSPSRETNREGTKENDILPDKGSLICPSVNSIHSPLETF